VHQASHLHPEFGLLCPSRGFGRKVRVSLFFLAFLGMGALVLTSVRNFDADVASMTVAAAGSEGRAGEARTDPQINQSVDRATVTGESPAPSESRKSGCEKNASSHRNWECRTDNAPRPRRARAANERPLIAALTLGHKTPPSFSAAPENPTEATNAAAMAPAVAEPSPPGPTAKKVVKGSQSRRAHVSLRNRIWRDERRTAFAYYDRPLRRQYPSFWGRPW
jgi:hypothetical protein